MGNIILTTECQRRCSYCFAKDNKENPMLFNMENFKTAIEWIIDENPFIQRIGILGGEPTLHPNFVDFIDYVLSKRLNTVIFTNGMIEDYSIYESIIDAAFKNEVRHIRDFSFCLNINEEKYRSKKEIELQQKFMKELGKVTILSFNIFEESFDPYFLIELILQNKLYKSIRLGIAAPLGNKNKYLNVDSFEIIGDKLFEFCKEATRNNISIGFDCGFTFCILEKYREEVKELMLETWVHNCNPTLDIYPDLTVGCCYPLSNVFRENLKDWDKGIDLVMHWLEKLENIEPIYEKCKTCEYFNNNYCNGGCRAHAING